MTLTVSRDDALSAVSAAAKAATPRTTIPILTCLRLSATGGRLTVTGTNIDQWVDVDCAADGRLDPVCPAGDKLLAAIKAAPAGSSVSLEERPAGLLVRYPGGRSLLPLLPAEDYPAPREVDGGATMTVQATDLHAALAKVAPCVDRDGNRFYLAGVRLRVRKGAADMAATDGHRLTMTPLACAVDGAWPEMIIPSVTIGLLAALKGEIRLSTSDGVLRAAADGMTITSRLIDGTYPDVDRLPPPAENPVATFKTLDLRAAVERVLWATDGKDRIVGLKFEPGRPAIAWAWNSQSPSEAAFDCENATAFEVGFTGRYLADLCQYADSDELTMHATSNRGPHRFVADDPADIFVVMPQAIQAYTPNKALSDD